jgi:hypothetical protein
MGHIKQVKLPSFLNKYDIYFLSRRLNLSKGKSISLVEQERDFHLIIQQICHLPLTKKQTKNLSDSFLITLLIFRYGKKKSLKAEDLIEFSKMVCESYHKIITGDVYLGDLKKNRPSFEHSSISLVMFGLFCDYFSDYVSDSESIMLVFKQNLDYIEKGLTDSEFSDVPSVLSNGIDILNEIKEKEWLDQTNKNLDKNIP